MNKKERTILTQFRKNARENLTTASRKTRIPVSTLYDRLQKYEGNIIKRHTSLLDFTQLGFSLKIQMVLKIRPIMRKKVESFLLAHERVNTLSVISNDYDFLIEVILKDFKELTEFTRKLDSFDLIDKHEFYVVDELKKESFLTEDAVPQNSHYLVITYKIFINEIVFNIDMVKEIIQYLSELTGIGRRGVDVEAREYSLMRVYSGLIDNSPEQFLPFLNYIEALGYAQEMYLQRMPDVPSKKRTAYELVSHGVERILDIYPDAELSVESKKNHHKLNPFSSDSLADRIEYGIRKAKMEKRVDIDLNSKFTDYIPRKESRRRDSEFEEHYELLPSQASHVGTGECAEAMGYIKGIAEYLERKNLVTKINLNDYLIEREQLIPLDQGIKQTKTKQKKSKKKKKEDPTNPYDADARKDFNEQHARELEREFVGFDRNYHDTHPPKQTRRS